MQEIALCPRFYPRYYPSMKEFKLCGLGNAIVDIFLEVSDSEFAAHGYDRGSTRLVDLEEQKDLLARYQKHEPRLVSGGSVANSVIAFSQLGGQASWRPGSVTTL